MRKTSRLPWVASALVALAGVPLLLLTTDFGYWTERTSNATTSYYRTDAYGYYYTEYWVGLDAPDLAGYAKVLLIVLAASVVYPAVQALRSRPTSAWRAAAAVGGGIAVGGVFFVAQVLGEYDWWLDAGFYGSLASALAATGLLYGAARAGAPRAEASSTPASVAPPHRPEPLAPLSPPAPEWRALYGTDRRRQIAVIAAAGVALLAGVAAAIVAASGSDASEAELLPTETVEAAPAAAEYTTVLDDSGTISLAVPEDWTDVDRSSADEGGSAVPAIYAAPDLRAYNSSWAAPGLSLRALPLGAEDGDLEAIVTTYADGWDTGTCDAREGPEAEPGLAHVVLVNCGEPSEFHLFAMREDGEPRVLYLELNLPMTEPRADEILETVPGSARIER